MRNFLIPVLLIAALSGCDIIDQPKGDMATPTPPGGGSVTRNVLLEDCTGFRCNNCPDAAIRAMQLKDIYGDRLVVVAVHMVNTFAEPMPPNYITDFRTPAGTAYEQTFGISALPTGMVNRKEINGSRLVSRYSWSTATAGMIDQAADVDLRIDTLIYNSVANTVSGTISGIVLHPLSNAHKITIYLTEDHVIDWQTNNQANPPDVPNYEHRHVLRGALNSPYGGDFMNASSLVGDTISLPFTYPMPTNVLQPDNCSLVAYVYSTAVADQYEVKQVTERKFVP
ncbi:MAG: Omp28-related outer membrane protein [Flavobacteriales bacterium]